MNSIIFNDILYFKISDYLNINDNRNLSYINKHIYYEKTNRKIRYYIIQNKGSFIISRFLKNYLNIYLDEIIIIKRLNAIYYYKNYEKIYINGWYNCITKWKQHILMKYKTKYTNNPTRLDICNLIKKMPICEVQSIGW